MEKLLFKFEKIDDHHKRAKVFGGWILKTYEEKSHSTPVNGIVNGYDYQITTTFIPDPNHEWLIKDKADIRETIFKALTTYETKCTTRTGKYVSPLIDLLMQGSQHSTEAIEKELMCLASFIKYALSTKGY